MSEEEGRGGAFLVAGTLGSPGGIKRVPGCCRIGLEGGATYQPGEDAAKAREDWREGGKFVSQVTLCQQVSRRFIIGTRCHPYFLILMAEIEPVV